MGLEHSNNDLTLESYFHDTKEEVDIDIAKSKYFVSNELANPLKIGTYFLSLNCCSLSSKFDNIKNFHFTICAKLTRSNPPSRDS